MANLTYTVSMVSTISGAPLNTTGSGASVSLTTTGTDVIQSTQDVPTSYGLPDFGAIAFPAHVVIQNNDASWNIILSTDGTTDSKIHISPGDKMKFYLTDKTNFKWKTDNASTIKALVAAVEWVA
jgi:hypothetical protein